MPGEAAAGTAVATPPAAVGGGESAASSAPVSAPVSTPETPAAPPVAAPVTPAAPVATERPTMREGETNSEFLKRFGEWKAQQPAAGEKPAEPAKPAEEAKPAEPVKEEAKPVEEPKPGEEKPAEEALLPEDEISLDQVGLPDVKQINEAFKTVLDEHPEFRGPLNKALRLAKEAAPVLQLIPDEETAKFAVENASIFTELQDSFSHISDAQSGTQFLQKLAEMSVIKGEDGKPLMENGAPVLHPSFSQFGMAVFTDVSDFLRSQYEALAQQGDENAQSVLAALDVIKGVTSPSPAATGGEEVPEHIKQREAEVQRREAELRQQSEQAERQRVETWNDTMEEEVNDVFGSIVQEVLSKITVPEFNKEYVSAEIASGIAQKILANPLFQAQRKHLLQQGFSDQTRQRYVALTKRYARDVVMDVARPVLTKAGGKAMATVRAQQERQASQEALSRNEPKGGTAVPIPVATPKVGGRLEQFRQEYRAKTGEAPDDRTEVQFLTNKFKWGT